MKKLKKTVKGLFAKEPPSIVPEDRSASNTSLTSSFEVNAGDDGDQSDARQIRFLQMKLDGKDQLEHILRNRVEQEKEKYTELEAETEILKSLVNQLSSSLEDEKNKQQQLLIKHEQQKAKLDIQMRQELFQSDLRMQAMAVENDSLSQRNEQLSITLTSEKRKKKQLQKDYVRHCVDEEKIDNMETLVKFIASMNGYDVVHLSTDIRDVLAKMENLVGQDWHSLGLALGVKSETLEMISHSQETLTAKLQHLIKEWTLQESNCSASRLVEALQSIGRDPLFVCQMPPDEIDCFERNRTFMVENLTRVCIASVCDKLYERGAITTRTKAAVLKEQSVDEMVVCLVLSLQYIGAGTLQTFCDVLRDCDCGFIADTLLATDKTDTETVSGTFTPDSQHGDSSNTQSKREEPHQMSVSGNECSITDSEERKSVRHQNVTQTTSVSWTADFGEGETGGFHQDEIMAEEVHTTNELSLSSLEVLQDCKHSLHTGSPVACEYFMPLLFKCIKALMELQRQGESPEGTASGHLDHDGEKVKHATLKSFLLSLLDHVGVLDDSVLSHHMDPNAQCMTLLFKLLINCGQQGESDDLSQCQCLDHARITEKLFPCQITDLKGEDMDFGERPRIYWTFRRPSGNILHV